MPQDWFSSNAPKQDWFASNAPPVDKAKVDAVRQSVADASTVKPLLPQNASEWMESAKKMTLGIMEGINPLPALESLYFHPIDTIKGLGQAQGEQAQKAQDAFRKGNYSEAIGHTIAYVLPLVGPAAANVGEKIGGGEDIAEGVGQGIGMVAPAAIHTAGSFFKGKSVAPSMITKNPAEAAAVKYGIKEGLPVDAATATGNPAVRGAQWLADRSIVGSLVNAKQSAATAEALTSKLGKLAGPAITPEQSGAALHGSLGKTVEAHAAAADAAYSKLRKLEADPKNLVSVQTGTQPAPLNLQTLGQGPRGTIPVTEEIPLAADTRNAKAALKPILDQIKAQMPVAQQRASAGLKAIENIVNGPDFAPASQVDANLSAIKSIARGTQDNGLRNVSQGLAAKAVSELSDAVDNAVAQGGPDAVAALKAGREATRAKYEVADVAKAVREEPVQAFNQMVYSKDAGIDQLRAVAEHAPKEMPKIGSAFLNDILTTATKDGGFTPGRGATKWQQLGPQTKSILFKDPQYVSDLDNFFILAKKLSENPNPSGSGYIAALGAQGYAAAANPIMGAITQAGAAGLSRMLHSPSVVRALVDGMTVSAKAPQTAATGLAIMKTLSIVKRATVEYSENSRSPQNGQSILIPAAP